MSFKTELLENNIDLQEVLNIINELPIIDINTPTGLTPTEFTNVLKDSATIITPDYRLSSSSYTSGSYTAAQGAFVLEFTIPKESPYFRFRGYTPYNSYINYSTDEGSTWKMAYFYSINSSVDEYGDTVWATTLSSVTVPMKLRITLKRIVFNSSITEEEIRNSNAIMTINQPIGIIAINKEGE